MIPLVLSNPARSGAFHAEWNTLRKSDGSEIEIKNVCVMQSKCIPAAMHNQNASLVQMHIGRLHFEMCVQSHLWMLLL